jgi:hypothetical protein
MIDGEHIAKVAVQDAAGAFEVFEVIAPAAPMAPPHVSPWTGVLFLLQGGSLHWSTVRRMTWSPAGWSSSRPERQAPSTSSASPPDSWRSPQATALGGSSRLRRVGSGGSAGRGVHGGDRVE